MCDKSHLVPIRTACTIQRCLLGPRHGDCRPRAVVLCPDDARSLLYRGIQLGNRCIPNDTRLLGRYARRRWDEERVSACPGGLQRGGEHQPWAAFDRRRARGAIGESAQPGGRRSLRPRLRKRRGRGLAEIAPGKLRPGARRARRGVPASQRGRESQPQRTTAFPTRPRPRRERSAPLLSGIFFLCRRSAHRELPDGRIHFDPVAGLYRSGTRQS